MSLLQVYERNFFSSHVNLDEISNVEVLFVKMLYLIDISIKFNAVGGS